MQNAKNQIRTRRQGDTPFFPNMLNNGKVEVCLKEDVDAAIAELKAKLEDASVRERKLNRALWLARLRSLRNFSVLAYFQTIRAKGKESNMDFDEMAYRIDLARVKCRAKVEEYK